MRISRKNNTFSAHKIYPSMKIYFSSLLLISLSVTAVAQKYEFQPVTDIRCQPVESQGNTGTCWSFSSTSFLESEILRKSGKSIDLSEMYNVRHTYPAKAYYYVQRHGSAQFGEGGLNHDVIKSMKTAGLVPQSAFTGYNANGKHDHSAMVKEMEVIVKANAKKPEAGWKQQIESILDKHLGADVREFTYEGKKYTPESFLEMTGLKASDYLTITSFTHAKFYDSFTLEVPDNFSNGSFYNLPLDEFTANIDHALEKGFTLALDADVSEKTFSAKTGMAVIPQDLADEKAILNEIKPEKKVTPEMRQAEFENFNTTDDHLMHIVGKVKDQKGNFYYKVKNSWGTTSGREGYIYMSAAYLKLKALAVMLHKDALLESSRKKLKI